MLHSGNESLAGLTTSTSTRSTRSITTFIGARALGRGRLLEPDVEGALQVVPSRNGSILECPFNFLECFLIFPSHNDWLEHSLTHFRDIPPPTTNKCAFCEQEFTATTGRKSWEDRMDHVALHHQLGHKLAHSRNDLALIRYLWNHRIMADAEYRELVCQSGRPTSSYSTPPTSSSSISSTMPYTVTHNDRRERRNRR